LPNGIGPVLNFFSRRAVGGFHASEGVRSLQGRLGFAVQNGRRVSNGRGRFHRRASRRFTLNTTGLGRNPSRALRGHGDSRVIYNGREIPKLAAPPWQGRTAAADRLVLAACKKPPREIIPPGGVIFLSPDPVVGDGDDTNHHRGEPGGHLGG
jgi:hypothetical protein